MNYYYSETTIKALTEDNAENLIEYISIILDCKGVRAEHKLEDASRIIRLYRKRTNETAH